MSREALSPFLRTCRLARSHNLLRSGPSASPPSAGLIRRPASSLEANTPTRAFATAAPGRARRGINLGYLFTGLVSVGALLTVYSVLEYMYAFQTWPEPVRTPLKNAIKARNQGEPEKAERWFRRAIEAARSIPSSSLQPDPLLKLSGLHVAFSSLLETLGKPSEAYLELRTAFELFGKDPLGPDYATSEPGAWATGHQLTKEDHIRAIGLSQKLGQLALQIGGMSLVIPYPRDPSEGGAIKTWDDAAEKYLSGALTAMLRLGLANRSVDGKEPVVAGRDVDLPERSVEVDAEGKEAGGKVDKRGLGMTMESLAEVYTRKGRHDLAGQLLIQAVSTLLPPRAEEVPRAADRCQAAMLMTTISSHASQPGTPQAIKAAKSWSLRALQIAEQTLGDSPEDAALPLCGRAKTVGLYNMGMLAEMERDLPEALREFNKALEAAKEAKFLEGRRQALDAIRRVRSLGNSSSPSSAERA